MSKIRVMNNAQIEWAWNKWLEGYRQKDIAAALGVNTNTVQRRLSELQDQGREYKCPGKIWRSLPPIKETP